MTNTFVIIGLLSSALVDFFRVDGKVLLLKQESAFKESLRNVCLQSMRHRLPLEYVVSAATINCNNRLAQLEDKRREYHVHFEFTRNQPPKCEAFTDEIRCTYHFDYSVVRIADPFDLEFKVIEVTVAYPHLTGGGNGPRQLKAI